MPEEIMEAEWRMADSLSQQLRIQCQRYKILLTHYACDGGLVDLDPCFELFGHSGTAGRSDHRFGSTIYEVIGVRVRANQHGYLKPPSLRRDRHLNQRQANHGRLLGQHIDPSLQAYKRLRKMSWDVVPRFDFPGSGPWTLFPMRTSGLYTGGSPGPDRVIIQDGDCSIAGQITHTGASGNAFVGCSGTS
ncbi:hypothetical protein SODALDRAFT_380768 [Sodiomyces alkalinus F11]|uniref:ribonuclease T1 n=1 Tax=Sodiomyces alkalinus (strain CBS 110278 / VKM F-3762 / F11) TaxID=1314773 RepID=A0A3N2PPM4_SODAK|nr:hypothetical protein SODALDRAFT_380768 [Sodiomyces alkalinus F11]ROT36455.1 hypothetical protein SODALDRAFT_380768 [Sodiomyces alkalinus F11]